MTYFRKFCYLNSSCIRKSITLMFMSSSRNKFTLLYQNSVTDVFVGFRPPCWCPSRWAPAWRLHTNLGKTFRRISRIRNILLAWILARVFVYLPPFISQIPDFIYWTVLIFILIYFEWCDTENQQSAKINSHKNFAPNGCSRKRLDNIRLGWWRVISLRGRRSKGNGKGIRE